MKMLEITINGTKTKVPPCTCGKCIVRRLRKDFFNPLPYGKNLNTTYKDDYDWKVNDPENPDDVYNRSKHNAFEGAYKEHIPTSLISTMKMDYKPFKVKQDPKEKEVEEPYKFPFMGKSTYKRQYPNWGAMVPVPDSEEDKIPEINVPLRGVPNYTESYPAYDPKYYKEREPLDFAKATLKFYGDLDPRTTYGDDYTEKDLNDPNYFPKDPLINTAKGENTALIPADNAPGVFDTTYKKDYIKWGNDMCELRKYLNARGMRYLVI